MTEIVKKMKGKKSCGLDTICGFSLKVSADILFEELKYIINLSIRSGQFPEEWKKAKIIPIFKNKGSRLEPMSSSHSKHIRNFEAL